MREDLVEDNDSLLLQKQPYNPELISIRKKLIAPNNILPGNMIRSQQPVHLLPVQPDFQSQPGFQMLLDEIQTEVEKEQKDKLKNNRSKNMLSKLTRGRVKSELSSEAHKKEQLKLIEYSQVVNKTVQNLVDTLDFLNKNIRNLLINPSNIVFISKSAFISNLALHKYKLKSLTQKHSPQEKKTIFINFLQNNRHFGTTSYAFDLNRNQDEVNSLVNFPNTDEILEFDDNFQSSNIYSAMRCDDQMLGKFKKEQEVFNHLYFLTVRLDYNTRSYGQWFYFKVKRTRSSYSFSRNGTKNLFKFMIINMTKNSSLFGKGLKISVCRNGVWKKEGININYYKNSLRREQQSLIQNIDNTLMQNSRPPETYYTLQFTLQILEEEQIYISYNEPYTYTRLGKALDEITNRFENNKSNIIEFKRNILCNTYLNNNIEVLTFSAKASLTDSQQSEVEKKVIFIMGRTHPIQTAGSHVIQGILNEISKLFIDNPTQQHKRHVIYKLLQNYILKIIPMVNPDGVILGNSRCNIAGYDLNRSWKLPRLEKCKETYYIKKHILQYQKRIEMFIDLHAHSKKKNVFAYGCHDNSNPFSTREFPFLLSKLSQNDFLFQQCRFTKPNQTKGQNQRMNSKEGTARIFLYDTLKIPNIFTIQNSYCSAKGSVFHYDKCSYQVIGADILKAISLYFSPQFKSNALWQMPKQPQKEKQADPRERKRFSNQSCIQVSLNTTYNEIMELKVTINSEINIKNTHKVQEQISQQINVSEIRAKYLDELHQKEENITIGFSKDNDASQSQEQERIYETQKKKKEKMHTEGANKKMKDIRTDRLMTYLQKNAPPTAQQKTKTSTKKSVLNFSNNNSQVSLVKITKITKNRFHTINKPIELNGEQDFDNQQLLSKRERVLIKKPLTPKKKKPVDSELFRVSRKDNFLSIVEIGLNEDIDQVSDLRFNLVQRIQAKERIRSINTHRETKPIHNEHQKKMEQMANSQMAHRRQDQIKQYMRRLIKPKQMLEKKERQEKQERNQKTERQEKILKQSSLYFPTDLRLSKLISMQNSKRAKAPYV